MIVGIDEVGRGAWAGPLAVGAVLLGGVSIDGLTDSKKLTKKQREALDREIRQKAIGVGIGWVSAPVIDQIGLTAALKLASRRAIAHIRHEYHEIIIDGNIAFIDDPRVTVMKKADLLVPSVSAASVVAKVARDNYMKHVDKVFPGYRFTGHVGYGTAAHREAIAKLGVTPLHRLSYMPLGRYRNTAAMHASDRFVPSPDGFAPDLESGMHGSGTGLQMASDQNEATDSKSMVSTKKIGDDAEETVAQFLIRQGHEIIDRNWRTKFCEIDIVSLYDGTVYFTEVKYRRSDRRGGGLAAITLKKQRQMAFAAEYFAVARGVHDKHLRLAAASVTGTPPQVVDFLELA
ncbi:ribonuclease HII [Streptomyces caniscabiei]|uniref:ribonuclease HII n=1 Tax=Streptomyces caniscabiei TaxID=2746961 RepID=UPI0029A735FF|nr:ribonuclease HII [Streptomyces caniscabiei]MDX2775871.1 ribonuclease HII [Streptomyces caniscabiei]